MRFPPHLMTYQALVCMWNNRNSYLLLVKVQTCSSILGESWSLFATVTQPFHFWVYFIGKLMQEIYTRTLMAALLITYPNWKQTKCLGTSLMGKWLRTHLPIQGARVQALVREDPTCRRATKPVHRNYWACALEPTSHNYWAHELQLLKPACLDPVLCNKRSHHNEKPAHCKEE